MAFTYSSLIRLQARFGFARPQKLLRNVSRVSSEVPNGQFTQKAAALRNNRLAFFENKKRDPISIKKVACVGSSLAAVLLPTQSSCSRRLGAFLGDKQSEQSFRVRAT